MFPFPRFPHLSQHGHTKALDQGRQLLTVSLVPMTMTMTMTMVMVMIMVVAMTIWMVVMFSSVAMSS